MFSLFLQLVGFCVDLFQCLWKIDDRHLQFIKQVEVENIFASYQNSLFVEYINHLNHFDLTCLANCVLSNCMHLELSDKQKQSFEGVL